MEQKEESRQRTAHQTTGLLVLVVCAMFGFGYALVPLYDLVCEITGYNGRTSKTTQAATAVALEPDLSRELKVEFLGNVDASLPWEFYPKEDSITIHPGEMITAYFVAKNRSNRDLIGQATPFVAPREANKHFIKTECFCFTEQAFAAGEQREMPVTFMVNPELEKGIDTVTLSYTFFQLPGA
jgi:cytochrome c oxidase assembly protein subunit 11